MNTDENVATFQSAVYNRRCQRVKITQSVDHVKQHRDTVRIWMAADVLHDIPFFHPARDETYLWQAVAGYILKVDNAKEWNDTGVLHVVPLPCLSKADQKCSRSSCWLLSEEGLESNEPSIFTFGSVDPAIVPTKSMEIWAQRLDEVGVVARRRKESIYDGIRQDPVIAA